MACFDCSTEKKLKESQQLHFWYPVQKTRKLATTLSTAVIAQTDNNVNHWDVLKKRVKEELIDLEINGTFCFDYIAISSFSFFIFFSFMIKALNGN